MITIIAAITRDNALGRNGELIYRFSADMKHFKSLTTGHPIIMGRKTFESFPKGALPDRRNVVITRNAAYHAPGIEVFTSLNNALKATREEAPFIIGGGEIYRQAFTMADCLEITMIDAIAPDADTFFPVIDPHDWTLVKTSETQQDPKTGVKFKFLTYCKKVIKK